MWIMQPVWVISALYLSAIAVYWYFSTRPAMTKDFDRNREQPEDQNQPPQPIQVSVAALHCGAGCVIGDVIAENLTQALGLPFSMRLIIAFVLAYAFGIVFQYFSIAPMRNLSLGAGILAAVKADTISISMFEVGMFGWMALVYFVLFSDPHLHPNEAVFWFMMQIAMIVGWATAYPANLWLIKKGWKEKMPQYVPSRINIESPVRHAA